MVFSGTVQSDFLKLVGIDDTKRQSILNYAAGDFATIRQTLIDYARAVYPLDYNNFIESDFGMFLIELIAAMGSINSFKADYLANENYLRTARSRNSVKKLLELIGVRMKGPIGAAANARITMQTAINPALTTAYTSITPDQRVVSITSPEDGATLTYTLYKVLSNGKVDLESNNTGLQLNNTEAATSSTFTNLVLLEGALVTESGAFATTDFIKTVKLTNGPVVEGSIQVFVDGNSNTSGIYSNVENIYLASGPTDKVFQIISDDNYGATIVFGDNNLGVSPSIGDQYTILYRVGGGSRGNIKNSFINTPVSFTYYDGVGSSSRTGTLENVSQGTGGADAETVDHAKRYAPLTFRRQDRLVTLSDFKGFVNSYITSYGSIGKATAIVRRAYSSANIIDVIVLEKANDTQLRKATPEYKRQILAAIDEKKMLTDEIVVVDGLIRTLDIILSVRCDKKFKSKEETIKLKVRDTVLSYFQVDNNDFGKEFIPQELTRNIFDIDEVQYSTCDNVPNPIRVELNEIIQLNNLTINMVFF